MPLFSSKKNKEVILILDIGSGSVAGSFVEFSKDHIPKILYIKRVPIKFLHLLEGQRFKKEMLKSLGVVLNDLGKNGLNHILNYSKNKIGRVYCSLASPWFVSQTKTVRISRGTPFVVSRQFVSDFLRKEKQNFEDSNLFKYGSSKKTHPELIERKLTDIKINGYNTDNPFGKKAEDVEFNLFMSVSESSLLEDIKDTVLKTFFIERFSFHSFTLAAFSTVRDIHEEISNFLLLDITSEVTDISLIKSRNILKTMSFPIGKNSFIRGISNALKMSREEAESLIKLSFSKTLEAKKAKILEKATENLEGEWTKGFQKALTNLYKNSTTLPRNIFFTADDDFASLYGKLIENEKFAQYSISEGSFNVNFINISTLGDQVFFEDKSNKDVFIAVESVFFNRIFELRE